MTIQELLNWAPTATPAAIFCLMWILERIERIKITREWNAERKELIPAVATLTVTIQTLKDLFHAGRG